MDAFIFYSFFAFSRILAVMPLRMLYGLSGFFYFLLYHFPSYRRKVVEENLRNSFPEKNHQELIVIEKKFYRHLADLVVESIKLPGFNVSQLKKHISFSNMDILERLYSSGRDVIAVLGHYNNWEWLSPFPHYTSYKSIIIYKPLANKYFDRYINKLRIRHGMTLAPMSDVIREILKYRGENIRTFTAFISDQTPAKNDIKYWTTFLNQDTPVFTGAEKIAAKYDMAVVFLDIQKIKRGHYNLSAELLFEHTAGLPGHLITDTHVRRLEEQIREKPEYWLWTHRRWKYKRENNSA